MRKMEVGFIDSNTICEERFKVFVRAGAKYAEGSSYKLLHHKHLGSFVS